MKTQKFRTQKSKRLWHAQKAERIVPKRFKIQLGLLYFLLLLSNLSREYEGEDILAARESFSSAHPIDIWGAFPGLFYSLIPDWPIEWNKLLIAIQLSLTLYSVLKIRSVLWLDNKKPTFLFTTISIISLYFSTFLTRDSTMFSFLIFGVANISSLTLDSPRIKKYLSLVPILIGASFRPWLSAVGALIVMLSLPSNGRDKRVGKIVLILIMSTSPLFINQGTYFVNSELRKVYPEMQVIVMDVASIRCLGIDDNARDDAAKTLALFLETNQSISTNFCNSYRTNTWQSIGEWDLSEIDPTKPSSEVKHVETDKVKLTINMSKQEVTKFRSAWLRLLSNYPREYVGVKILQAAQLSIGGDSATLIPDPDGKLTDFFHHILYFPFNLVIEAHFLSIAILFGFMLALFPSLSGKISRFNSGKYLAHFLIPIAWILISTIAYIGDNGRYVYSGSILFYFLIFIYLFNNSKVVK